MIAIRVLSWLSGVLSVSGGHDRTDLVRAARGAWAARKRSGAATPSWAAKWGECSNTARQSNGLDFAQSAERSSNTFRNSHF
jgi:hypothetical protein